MNAVADYRQRGIEALRDAFEEEVDTSALPALLLMVMEEDDEDSFLFIYKRTFPFSFFLKQLLTVSTPPNLKFLKLIISSTAFGLVVFEVVERNRDFDVKDICVVLRAYSELFHVLKTCTLQTKEYRMRSAAFTTMFETKTIFLSLERNERRYIS